MHDETTHRSEINIYGCANLYIKNQKGVPMETRKLQITGGSTHIVSLPKRWITSSGVSKNDSLVIIERSDGTLLLAPERKGKRKESLRTVVVKKGEAPEHLERRLIGAYIAGFRVIAVKAGKGERIEPVVRKQVRSFTSSVIGPEIVEESIDRIVMRDLLNPLDLRFDESIRRMFHIIKNMHQSAMLALVEVNRTLAADVISRDVEVNKLYLLIYRLVNTISDDPIIAQEMLDKYGLSVKNATNFLIIARLLERIGDHACRVASNVIELEGQSVPRQLVEGIASMNEKIVEMLGKCISALTDIDLSLLNGLIDEVNRLREKDIPAQDSATVRLEVTLAVGLGNIVESNSRTSKYTIDIAETLIDLAMSMPDEGEDRT